MEILVFLVLVGLVVMLAPYILGAALIVLGVVGIIVTGIVIFIHELWKDHRR